VNSDRGWDWSSAGVRFFALSPYFFSRGSSRGTAGVALMPTCQAQVPQTPSINASAAHTINPQFGMLLNYFAGQTSPPSSYQNRPVRPLGPTG
jgi:hypothetical protein